MDEDEEEEAEAYIAELMRRGGAGMLDWRNVGGGMDIEEGEWDEEDEDEDVEFGDADEDAYMDAYMGTYADFVEATVDQHMGGGEELDGDLEDMDELD